MLKKLNQLNLYAQVSIQNEKGVKLYLSPVDFYSRTPPIGTRYVNLVLTKGKYTLK
jgi:hypothetical protein